MPMLTVGLFFIFVRSSCIHLATLKIHSVSKTPLNFEQRTLPEVLHNSKNEVTILVRIPFLFASDGMLVWSVCLLAATRRSTVAQQENRAGGDSLGKRNKKTEQAATVWVNATRKQSRQRQSG